MKSWLFFGAGLALLAIAGCRSDPAVAVLERELRLKEDEIYRLRSTLEDLQDCTDCTAQRVSSTARDDSDSHGTSRRGSRSTVQAAPSVPGGLVPPKVELSTPGGSEVPESLKRSSGPPASAIPEVPEHLQQRTLPPIQDGGGPTAPGGAGTSSGGTGQEGPALGGSAGFLRTSRKSRGRARGQLVSDDKQSAAGPTSVDAATGDSRQVASIVLDRALTGGISDGGQAGDPGVLVVVEPRDAKGRAIDAAADIAVVVLDPAVPDAEGNAAPVARWDFTAAETAGMLRRTGSGPAIHIEAAWPESPPVHSKLHVFVRYTTADGRKLEANQPMEVVLPGEKLAARPLRRDPNATPDQPQQPGTPQSTATSQRPVWSPER